jgi:hypothetical protein
MKPHPFYCPCTIMTSLHKLHHVWCHHFAPRGLAPGVTLQSQRCKSVSS